MGQTLIIDLGGPFATVAFAVEDELDISLESVGLLREALKAFIRTDEVKPVKAARTRKRTGADPLPEREIRRWARENGFPELAGHGRIPNDVREAFDAREDPDGHRRVTPLNVARNAVSASSSSTNGTPSSV